MRDAKKLWNTVIAPYVRLARRCPVKKLTGDEELTAAEEQHQAFMRRRQEKRKHIPSCTGVGT